MTISETAVARAGLAARDRHAAVAVIIVTYNSAADIGLLLDDLRVAACEHSMRVVVVDNDSADDTAAIVKTYPDVEFVDSGGNLGYAGGINAALPYTGPCESVLILNPDLRVLPAAISRMLATIRSDDHVGAVVPRILDEDGTTYPSLRFEPSTSRMAGDACFGRSLWRGRPGYLSEFDYRRNSYRVAHDVDWATGAAIMIRGEVVRRVGYWDERFFLYSEEVEFCRRVRDAGFVVRYEPDAVVSHRLGGSGSSPALAALMAVNRVRYVELHHGKTYTAAFRCAVALAEALRAYDSTHRHSLAVVASRRRWERLPRATRRPASQAIKGPVNRGAVIVPAFDEARVIEQSLAPLSRAAIDGFIELIVVCNGCTDDTADRARAVPGARVLELPTGSKTLAMNAGDAAATLWPRLYLDADIQISAAAVLAVLDRLSRGDVLAARPAFRYGTDGANAIVRSYYRARGRMAIHEDALWWAGVYGLTARGHRRFGQFPLVTGDDKFVDSQFAAHEKAVVDTERSTWVTPTSTAGLITVLGRHSRGNAELAADSAAAPRTSRATALAVLRSARGPRAATDAAVYLVVAIVARWRAARQCAAWERDDSSRAVRRPAPAGSASGTA